MQYKKDCHQLRKRDEDIQRFNRPLQDINVLYNTLHEKDLRSGTKKREEDTDVTHAL